MQQTIDAINNLDIIEQIGKYIKLKKAGTNYVGLSPFTNEKNPSFTVSPAKNIFKCFSSGIGGSLITFIREHEKLSFIEAVKKLARENNIPFEDKEYRKEDIELEKKKESFKIIHQLASEFFRENLYLPGNAIALEYVNSRIPDKTVIEKFEIGFAPDSYDALLKYAGGKAIKLDSLIECGLIKQNENKKTYDYFRSRIIFPIHDIYGSIIGFGGRVLPSVKLLTDKDKSAKYLNSPETIIYNKGRALYGLFQARKSIQKKDGVYIVEGYTDVTRLHIIGIENVVSPCGTALTTEQILLIKRFTLNIILVFDGDSSGKKNMDRCAELIIRERMNCNIIALPAGGDKTDPDSFFKSLKQFKQYKEEHLSDYIIYKAAENLSRVKNYPDRKTKLVIDLCQLIVCYDSSARHDVYVEKLSELIKPKKLWTDTIKSLIREEIKEESQFKIPEHVKLGDYERYGFYIDNNRYFFRTKYGPQMGSNFTLTPLFHVESVINAKRLFEIKNEFCYTRVIEIPQKDMVSLNNFKVRVESLGNFIWYGTETDLNKLKGYLYEKTKTCIEIIQLGWQKEGFWAWGNGIFNGDFLEIDKHGIVNCKEKNYYLPAFSDIYQYEDTLFISERRFIHIKKGDISLKEYGLRLIDVFGDNAKIALCYYFASLFRDYIVKKFNFFPLLNLFGPKGAGKTELAISLLQLFGRQNRGPNLNNTTKAALADHVAQVSNGLVHIDEYKNNIDFEKIEFLKGLWDSTGRTRMNMDKDKKKETTAVDCGIIISGQEMPTADIALFSRFIYLTFYKIEYCDEEKKIFNELKDVEKKGLTHITHEILKYRQYFIEDYLGSYDKVANDLNAALHNEIIEDRIFRNWLIAISAYNTLRARIEIPFDYDDIIKLAAGQILSQNRETKRSNEISSFWNIIQYLYADGLIMEEVDYKIVTTVNPKTDIINSEWNEPRQVLYLQHSRIFTLYRKHGKLSGEKILPVDSIDYYLRNDKRFLGKKKSERFKAVDNRGTEIQVETQDGIFHKKKKITTAYAFLYEDLAITLHSEESDETIEVEKPLRNKPEPDPDQEDIPF